jgi:hypothetical protein
MSWDEALLKPFDGGVFPGLTCQIIPCAYDQKSLMGPKTLDERYSAAPPNCCITGWARIPVAGLHWPSVAYSGAELRILAW